MSAAPVALPLLLSQQSTWRVPDDLDRINANELKKIGRRWLDPSQVKLSKEPLINALRGAFKDDAAVRRVVQSLTPAERQVVAVYRRYGGKVSGGVIRLDLMARGILKIIEKRVAENYTTRQWESNPIGTLSNHWVLISENFLDSSYSSFYYGRVAGPERPFDKNSLHPGVAKSIEPAGPATWSIPPAAGVPHAITRRSTAEVALTLSRVLSFVSAKGAIKTRKDGTPAVPALRSIEKGVPIEGDKQFCLPEPQAFYLDVLMETGAIVAGGSDARVDHAAATKFFTRPDALQAHLWSRGWLRSPHWFDGYGTSEVGEINVDGINAVWKGREVLAWTLGCLARAGHHWYDLRAFLEVLRGLIATDHVSYLPSSRLAWDPKFPEAAPAILQKRGPEFQVAWWYSRQGSWFANALMVTLVELGLVERGRLGPNKSDPLVFRITEIGRAVFGAPEIVPTPVEGERKFLLIQPNFDVIAYLEQADAHSAGFLGRLTEGDSAASGPVCTFRLTQTSVYHAQESGLSHTEIIEFLRRHSQHEPPVNVLRSIADWSVKRENLTLRKGVTLLGFPTGADRDTYLTRHPGTACGERFVTTAEAVTDKRFGGNSLRIEPLMVKRHIFTMDEQGQLRTEQPMDIIQEARLRRMATKNLTGWKVTRDSIRLASASGLKPTGIRRYLEDLLVGPVPPLIDHAIDAWFGKGASLELSEAILLYVPDLAQFEAIAKSRRLRPFLLGSPGPHWLAVAQSSRKKLTNVLEELGYQMNSGSTPGLPSLPDLKDKEI